MMTDMVLYFWKTGYIAISYTGHVATYQYIQTSLSRIHPFNHYLVVHFRNLNCHYIDFVD